MRKIILPLIGRIKATWFIWRYRNFILVYNVKEITVDGKKGRRNAYLRRTDYDTESDFYTMKSSMLHQFGEQIMDENKSIGDYSTKTKDQ